MATASISDRERAAPCEQPSATSLAAEPVAGAAPGLADALAAAALAGDQAEIAALIAATIKDGWPLDRVLVGPVTAAARRLGDFWIEDSYDFVAVTMAAWKLRRGVEDAIESHPGTDTWCGRRAVFAAVPGDQHGFGCFLISEVFARAGWLATPVDSADLVGIVAEEWIDMVGLTATADRHCTTLAATITELRRASCNPRLAVAVGGRVFADDPSLADRVGADGTAPDAMAALALANRLIAVPGVPC